MRFLTTVLTLMLLAAIAVNAQTVIPVAPGQYLDDVIAAQEDTPDKDYVFELERGQIYAVKGTVNPSYVLKIQAKDGEGPLPVIWPERPGDIAVNDFKNQFVFVEAQNDVYIKNLHFSMMSQDESRVRIMDFFEPKLKLVVEGCVFEYTSSWKGAIQFKSFRGTAIFKDNFIRNMMDDNGYTWSTFFHTQKIAVDTIKFVNNTLSNCANNVFAINDIPSQDNSPLYFEFDHNTVYGTGIDIFHHSFWLNVKITNNLFMNCMTVGQGYGAQAPWVASEFQNQDGMPYAYFKVDTLEADNADSLIMAATGGHDRIIQIHNNNYFTDQQLVDWQSAQDPAVTGPVEFLSKVSQGLFDDDENYPKFDYSNITFVDPDFVGEPDNVQKMIYFAERKVYYTADATSPDSVHSFDPDGDPWTTTEPKYMDAAGPGEDFSYSTASALYSAAQGGYPLGDLNWFPDKKAEWEEKGVQEQTAYQGTPLVVPGRIEAEFFDEGGEGVAYHDSDAGKAGGDENFRPDTDVEFGTWSEPSNGYLVGWTGNGEWLEYTVMVQADGEYDVTVAHSGPNDECGLKFYVDDVLATEFAFGSTGDWNTWGVTDPQKVTLTAGEHVLRAEFVFGAGGYNLDYIDIVKSTGVANAIAHTFALNQNYPNPFNPSTRIHYSLEYADHVSMIVYDVLGRSIRTLVNKNMTAGVHQIDWDGTNDLGHKVANGIYFYRLEANGQKETKQMLLLK